MRIVLLIVLNLVIVLGCGPSERQYFFLAEYPHLVVRDASGTLLDPREYIRAVNRNSLRVYEIRQDSAKLYYRNSGETYSGYIRTFDRGRYNLEAVFRDGNIKKLRFWYPNRELAQDMNYRTITGSAWTLTGDLAIVWSPGEVQYRYPATQNIRQIVTDTLTSFFDAEGELDRYTVRSDTAFITYDDNGTRRFQYPVNREGLLEGIARRWHANGTIQVKGQYKNGREAGV